MYARITVVVDGALEQEFTVADYAEESILIDDLIDEAKDHGYPTEIFILHHDHSINDPECFCVQMVSDHNPAHKVNFER